MPRGKSSVANQELLTAALQGLEAQKEKIEEQIQQVRALLGHRRGRPVTSDLLSNKDAGPRKRRQLSPAARKRIAAAQKRRWAEYRKAESEK